jgi:peptidoglycan hydrolase CwlO-like protein
MNVLGKILVFVNLVFSLLTAGLIIMVYTTRTNWHDAYDKQKRTADVIRADHDAAEGLKDQQIAEKDKQVQALTTQRQAEENAKKDLQKQLEDTRTQLAALSQTQTQGQQNYADLVKEVERRKTEVENLQKLLAAANQKVTDIDKRMDKLRDEAVNYRVQLDQSKERVASLQGQIESLARENTTLRSQLGGTTAPAPAPAGQPAPRQTEDLRGTVRKVDATGLITISPGSDAGVAVGQELTVYRLRPQAEYLGMIKILAVSPTEAVGRLQGARRGQVKVGDEVAANVLSR